MVRTSIVSAAFLVTLLGCSGPATGPSGEGGALLSILNAVDAGESVILSIDNRSIGLPSTGLSRTLELEPGAHRLTLKGSDGRLLASQQVALEGARSYSLRIARSSATTFVLPLVIDTVVLPQATQVKLRLFNLAEASGPLRLSLNLTGDPPVEVAASFETGDGTDPRFTTGYLLRTQGFHHATVTNATGEQVLAENGKHLAGGHVWEMLLVRDREGELQLQFYRSK